MSHCSGLFRARCCESLGPSDRLLVVMPPIFTRAGGNGSRSFLDVFGTYTVFRLGLPFLEKG